MSDSRDGANGNIETIFDGINRCETVWNIWCCRHDTPHHYNYQDEIFYILFCRDLLSLATAGHLADSEGDNGDVELDDEDSVGDERYNSSSSHNLSSFKRGGLPPGPPGPRAQGRSRSRGGEPERPRKSKDKEKHGRVGQLDERNLKKAANRYGTLPKGARIGAYLESMRVSGLTPEPGSDDTDTLDSHKSGATDPGHRVTQEVTPAMARSNSSHGGFPSSGHKSRLAGQSPAQLPRRLQGFTPSPSPLSPRLKHSALQELDFPPPPAELPGTARGKARERQSSESCEEPGSVRSYSDSSLRLGVSPTPPPPSHQLVQEMASSTPPLPSLSPLPPAQTGGDPASQLVTELFESIKLKSDGPSPPSRPPAATSGGGEATQKPVQDFKAGLRKVNQHPISHDKPVEPPAQINFKSQLKKTNSSLYAQPSTGAREGEEEGEEPAVVDFKSQLKKVKTKPSSHQAEPSQDLSQLKASLRAVRQTVELQDEDEGEVEEREEREDKRRSTGSISSLKKMWEDGAGDGRDPPSGDERPASVVKFEKRVWPPVPSTETEKPMVPVKPTVKPPPTSKPPPPKEPSCKPPPKPSQSRSPLVCNIYAAPNSVPPRPNISAAKPKLPSASPGPRSSKAAASSNGADKRADSTDSGLSSSNDKDNLVDLSLSLENLLTNISKEGLTKATAMSASDKVILSFSLSQSTAAWLQTFVRPRFHNSPCQGIFHPSTKSLSKHSFSFMRQYFTQHRPVQAAGRQTPHSQLITTRFLHPACSLAGRSSVLFSARKWILHLSLIVEGR